NFGGRRGGSSALRGAAMTLAASSALPKMAATERRFRLSASGALRPNGRSKAVRTELTRSACQLRNRPQDGPSRLFELRVDKHLQKRLNERPQANLALE